MNKTQAKSAAYDGFARRLNDACDAAGLPGFRNGRQSTIKDQLDVSAEAVRRWFAGESIPRPGAITQLAAMLKVDPSWLAYGTKSTAKKEHATEASAAVNYVASLLQFGGASIAFAKPGSGYDLTAIRRGLRFDVIVCRSTVSGGMVTFDAPFDYEDLIVVGVVHDGGRLDAVFLDADRLAAAEVRNARRRVVAPLDLSGFRPLTADGIPVGVLA